MRSPEQQQRVGSRATTGRATRAAAASRRGRRRRSACPPSSAQITRPSVLTKSGSSTPASCTLVCDVSSARRRARRRLGGREVGPLGHRRHRARRDARDVRHARSRSARRRSRTCGCASPRGARPPPARRPRPSRRAAGSRSGGARPDPIRSRDDAGRRSALPFRSMGAGARRCAVLVAGLALLLIAGCGGSGDPARRAPPPWTRASRSRGGRAT